MSPAPQRGNTYEDEMMVSWDTTNPTLAADLEGWFNYHISENRWYFWDGTSWLKLFAHGDAAGGDLAGTYPNPTIAADAVTFAKIQNITTDRLLGRDTAGSGDVEEIPLVTGGMLEFTGGPGLRVKTGGSGQVSILTTNIASAALEWRSPSNYPCYPIIKSSSEELTFPKISGTTFPTSPVDGQIFTHTTHRTMYYFDAAAAGWLSTHIYEFDFGNSADLAATAFCEFGELAAFQTFSSTIGRLIGAAARVVGIELNMASSGTCDVQVFDDGAAVTNATLSLSAVQSKADEALMSDTIAASSILGVKVTSGTAKGPFRGKVRLRRFET